MRCLSDQLLRGTKTAAWDQQICLEKTKFSGHTLQRHSFRLVFLPHIHFTAKSSASVANHELTAPCFVVSHTGSCPVRQDVSMPSRNDTDVQERVRLLYIVTPKLTAALGLGTRIIDTSFPHVSLLCSVGMHCARPQTPMWNERYILERYGPAFLEHDKQ